MSPTITASWPMQRGHGSAERPLTRELWERDSHRPSPAMSSHGNFEPATSKADYSRYYDRGFARREFERLFTRNWLFACREEDIPVVGDRVPFDLGPLSVVIVRSAEDEIKAYYNTCIHRGTKLCVSKESADTIVCPFHNWEWKLGGALKHIPSHWDFPDVTRRDGGLYEVRAATWGGYVFINMDPSAPGLEVALSIIPEHFAQFESERRYTAAHFRKLVPANWKIVQEAFQEAYHLSAIHPQAIPFIGDTQSQYDLWDDGQSHIARLVSPAAVPGMNADPSANIVAASAAYAASLQQWRFPNLEPPDLDPGRDPRAQVAQWHRNAQKATFDRTIDAPDGIMIDSLLYYMFPNLNIWLSETVPFVYAFLPHAGDPELSYFEARMLLPWPDGSPRPAPAPMIELGLDDSIAEKVPAFGFTGFVLDQDMQFMERVQAGARAADSTKHHQHLGRYQEMIIRRWQELVDTAVSNP